MFLIFYMTLIGLVNCQMTFVFQYRKLQFIQARQKSIEDTVMFYLAENFLTSKFYQVICFSQPQVHF